MSEAFVVTHRIPASGLPAWDVPDGARAPVAQVDPGLEVQLLAVHGSWAQVRFSNEWVAWVDGGRLEAVGAAGSAPARPRSRDWLLVVGALVVIGLATAAVVFLLSGDDEGSETVGTEEVQIAMAVPDGWTASDDGMAVAEQAADLTAAAPAGARASAETIVGDDDVLPEVEAALESEVMLAAETSVIEVSGVQAASVALEEDGYVRQYIVVRPPGEAPVLFTLEAPADQWEAKRDLLASVPGLAP